MRFGAMLLLALAVCSARARAADLVAVNWHPDASSLFRVDKTSGIATPVGVTGFSRLNSLAINPAGRLFSAGRGAGSPLDDQLITIDPLTGVGTSVGTLRFGTDIVSVRGLAFMPDGTMYVANAPQGTNAVVPHDLWRVDPVTLAATKIGNHGFSPQTLDVGPDGRLYSWEWISRSVGNQTRGIGLVTIDLETAAFTDVAPAVDGTPAASQGMVFSVDGNLYGISGALHRFDPVTGAARGSGPSFPIEFDMRGIAEINVPEPGGIVVVACAAGGLLRRKRR